MHTLSKLPEELIRIISKNLSPIDKFTFKGTNKKIRRIISSLPHFKNNHVAYQYLFESIDHQDCVCKLYAMLETYEVINHKLNLELSYEGITPFIQSIFMLNVNLVNKLISLNVHTDCPSFDYSGWTPLMFAVNVKSNPNNVCNQLRIINILIQNNADINYNNGSDTPLHIAIKSLNYEVIELLISLGADTNAHNICMASPLMILLETLNHFNENQGRKIFFCLLRNGADVYYKYEKGSILIVAINNELYEIVSELIFRGAQMINF